MPRITTPSVSTPGTASPSSPSSLTSTTCRAPPTDDSPGLAVGILFSAFAYDTCSHDAAGHSGRGGGDGCIFGGFTGQGARHGVGRGRGQATGAADRGPGQTGC